MTDKNLSKNRVKIVKEYLTTGEKLYLSPEFELVISSSRPDVYHVYSINKNGLLTFEYSMTEFKLKELIKSLSVDLIQRIFVESRIFKLQNKYIGENTFNLQDWEQSH